MRFKNYINRYSKNNRIYSEEELLAMTLAELLENESSIVSQDLDIGIPNYEELKKSPNIRWIDSYTNTQGNKEGGYYGSLQTNDFLRENGTPNDILMKLLGINSVKNIGEKTVLEGGIEENVYKLPEEQEEVVMQEQYENQDEGAASHKEEDGLNRLRESTFGKLLQDIFSQYSQIQKEQADKVQTELKNTSSVVAKTEQPFQNVFEQNNTEELQTFYEKFVEELIKRLRAKYGKYSGLSTGAVLQKAMGKIVSDNMLENEYYKNALKLKDGEQLTKKFLEENNIYSYQDINDLEKRNYYKEQLAKLYGYDVNDTDIENKLLNKKIVIPKETSRLYQYVKNSEELEKWILDNYDKIQKGEDYNNAITFSKGKILTNEGRALHNTIHNANLNNMKVNPDGSISGRIVDSYNFEKWNLWPKTENLQGFTQNAVRLPYAIINNTAYEQQKNDKLDNFYVSMPINYTKNEIDALRQKYIKK